MDVIEEAVGFAFVFAFTIAFAGVADVPPSLPPLSLGTLAGNSSPSLTFAGGEDLGLAGCSRLEVDSAAVGVGRATFRGGGGGSRDGGGGVGGSGRNEVEAGTLPRINAAAPGDSAGRRSRPGSSVGVPGARAAGVDRARDGVVAADDSAGASIPAEPYRARSLWVASIWMEISSCSMRFLSSFLVSVSPSVSTTFLRNMSARRSWRFAFSIMAVVMFVQALCCAAVVVGRWVCRVILRREDNVLMDEHCMCVRDCMRWYAWEMV